MLVPFESLPGSSKIWIYQSNRKLAEEEVVEIKKTVEDFLTDWAAHGTPLSASYQLLYSRFIIIAADSDLHNPSGCSIDASVQMIQEIEQRYGIDLLDKMNVTFKLGEHVAHKPLAEFKKMAKEKAVSGNTVVFNNLVNSLEEWEESWEVPAAESWHSRFF